MEGEAMKIAKRKATEEKRQVQERVRFFACAAGKRFAINQLSHLSCLIRITQALERQRMLDQITANPPQPRRERPLDDFWHRKYMLEKQQTREEEARFQRMHSAGGQNQYSSGHRHVQQAPSSAFNRLANVGKYDYAPAPTPAPAPYPRPTETMDQEVDSDLEEDEGLEWRDLDPRSGHDDEDDAHGDGSLASMNGSAFNQLPHGGISAGVMSRGRERRDDADSSVLSHPTKYVCGKKQVQAFPAGLTGMYTFASSVFFALVQWFYFQWSGSLEKAKEALEEICLQRRAA